MTELLVIKSGSDYFRVGEEEILPCAFNKATVFPLAQIDEARNCCRRLQRAGVAATLMKLTIVEQAYGD
jgi:hypothetical protein